MGAIPYMTEVEDMAGGSLPGKLWLSQNYPNPFNSATVVQYRLSNPAHVRLEVFDLVGQRVALLVNSRQEAGHRSVLWNAAELPSGVYFYRLTAGSLSDMKRMILLK